MRWLILALVVVVSYGNSTNVSCVNGMCSNNTCAWGFYNTTYNECRICNKLRTQYNDEACCHVYSDYPNPSTSVVIVNSTFENDTGTVMVLYTPPRPICQHLWEQWGKCPPICDNIPPGEYCSMDIDCKDSTLCLYNTCCVVKYENCVSCSNGTGYCNTCKQGMAFNASGDLKCGYCPSWTYTTNNLCHLFTNCSSGFYVTLNGTLTSDRECTVVPSGYFSNGTNVVEPTKWSNCSSINNTWASFVGNSTHDVVCTNHSVCNSSQLIGNYGNASHDTNCSNKQTCPPGTYISDNGDSTTDRTCTLCVVGTFTDENNQLSCSPHKICGTGESYIFYGGYMHDSQCVPDSLCQFVTCLPPP
jgi:hypothetical protein